MVQQQDQISRRTFLKRVLQITATGVLLGLSTGGYAYLIEPFRLKIKNIQLSLPRLPQHFQTMRILQMSDLHYGFPLEQKHFAFIVETAMDLKPDLIAFTGDLADKSTSPIEEIIPQLKQLNAPLGKYAVLGNHDAGHPEVEQVFLESDFVLLRNQSQCIQQGTSQLAIVGVEDMLTGQPDLNIAMQSVPEDACTFLLAHCPDYADDAVSYPIDLQLSGHTHGGQVRLPLTGALATVAGGKKYVDDIYTWDNYPMQLHVDRGLGCSIVHLK